MSTEVPEIAIDTLEQELNGGTRTGTLLDVRGPGEYAAGHVPGAVHVPMDELPARADELDRETPVYVICASGRRSTVAARGLRQAGFDARTVAGGTEAWVSSGRDVETGAAAPRS